MYKISDTNCKFKSVCNFYPRCKAKSANESYCYRKDDRNLLKKIFIKEDRTQLKEELSKISEEELVKITIEELDKLNKLLSK